MGRQKMEVTREAEWGRGEERGSWLDLHGSSGTLIGSGWL